MKALLQNGTPQQGARELFNLKAAGYKKSTTTPRGDVVEVTLHEVSISPRNCAGTEPLYDLPCSTDPVDPADPAEDDASLICSRRPRPSLCFGASSVMSSTPSRNVACAF